MLPDSSKFQTRIDGKATGLYFLRNKNGLHAAFCNYGARWISCFVPDKNGRLEDVILGFDSIGDYLKAEEQYHGAVIGRTAGRIGRGHVDIDGKYYQLPLNEPGNHLHGGPAGLSFVIWDAQIDINEQGEERVRFYYNSPDGDQGYPGNLSINVSYTLTHDDAVLIEYRASTDQPTWVSLTNHAYFNLDPHEADTILDHWLEIKARRAFEFDARDFCLTGRQIALASTPLDFYKPAQQGSRITQTHPQLMPGRGFNSYYIFESGMADLHQPVVRLWAERSGRLMEIFTTEPGLQLYTAGYWRGSEAGKNKKRYAPFGGVALETHRFPANPGGSGFQGMMLRPGAMYEQTTLYKFSISKESIR